MSERASREEGKGKESEVWVISSVNNGTLALG